MKYLDFTFCLCFVLQLVTAVQADVFQWEYINAADPSQGKRQSTTLAPDGAGVDAVLGADLSGRDLTKAYLLGADLAFGRVCDPVDGCYLIHRPSNLSGTNLTQADLSGASLTGANVSGAKFREANLSTTNLNRATLTGADFTGADVRGANFDIGGGCYEFGCYPNGAGITLDQLCSTASYQANDLSGINLAGNDLASGNFAGQNLTNTAFYSATLTDADFREANLTNAHFGGANLTGANFTGQNLSNFDFSGATLMDADFSGAEVRGANFSNYGGTGITLEQLYSTASYQAHDLTGIILYGDLSGWNFAGQNLTNAKFSNSTLTGADFTHANVRGATFAGATTGLTTAQLYSTASYQARDLSGITLFGNNLSGANLTGQNLTNAGFVEVTLTDADFTGAEVRGAYFSAGGTGLTTTQLYSTASYQAHDLTGIILGGDLSDWNFAGQNLTNASFYSANLTGSNLSGASLTNANFQAASLTDSDFSGALVREASFDMSYGYGTGITLAQLYSTASYKAGDLSGINFAYNDLAGGNFARQNLRNGGFFEATLTGANFREANLANANFLSLNCGNLSWCGYGSNATLRDADLTAADARGAFGLDLNLSGTTTTNLIRPDGHIDSLDLDAGGILVVRDYDGDPARTDPNYGTPTPFPPIPITVDQHLTMAPGGTLRMVFEADAWDSTISFAPGIPVTFGGTLELTFAADLNPATQVGRTFDLFDWTGVAPTGAFAISSPYAWDLSNLYTTGEVTLTAIPEPAALSAIVVCSICLALHRGKVTS